MPVYKYYASDIGGKMSKGVAYACDPASLKESLEKENALFLVSFKEQADIAPKKRLGANSLSYFCRELGSLLGAGVPVVRALGVICGRGNDKKLISALQNVLAQIKKGSDLHASLAAAGVFPPLLVSVIRAGERSGRLSQSLLNMADFYEREKKLSSEIKAASLYPTVLLILTLGVIVAVFAFILPSFMNLFEDMKLPLITRIMIGISNLFTKYPLFLLLITAAICAIAAILSKIESIRLFADKLRLRLPVVGRLNSIICTARFAATLSALYSSGTGVVTALTLSGETVENRYIRLQLEDCLKKIRSGHQLSAALAEVDGFDSKLAETVAVGEESARLGDLLAQIADDYDFEAQAAAKRLVTLIEPLMTVFMAAIVLLVVCSVIIPVYELYSSIDGSYTYQL